jgi:CHASE3 domain sensor protein
MMVLRSEIIRLDEMLTWLVRAAAQTGDYKYVGRYNELLQALDDAIAEAMNLSPPTVREAVRQKTSAANDKLVDMETRAFALVKNGDLTEAKKSFLVRNTKRKRKPMQMAWIRYANISMRLPSKQQLIVIVLSS